MKDDEVYLRTILDWIREVEEFTREGHAAHLADWMMQAAGEREIEVIGEAAKRVSGAYLALHPAVEAR